jgi:hypothetical protein
MATLTSTTDSAENMRAALANDSSWRKPPASKPEPTQEHDVAATSDDQLAPKDYIEKQNEEIQEKKDKGPEFLRESEKRPRGKGWERRIHTLTRNWRTAEKRAAAAEARIAELEGRSNGGAPAQQQETPAQSEPAADEFPDLIPEPTETTAPRILTESERQYETRFAEGAKSFPDYETVMREADSRGDVIKESAEAAIRQTDNVPAIAYFLAKNPAVLDQLNNSENPEKDVAWLSAELKRIHAPGANGSGRPQAEAPRNGDTGTSRENVLYRAIASQPNARELTIELAYNPQVLAELNSLPMTDAIARIGRLSAELERKAVQRQSAVKPPAPISTVGGGSAPSSLPLDQLPPREYNRIRDQQERQRRSR